MKRHFAKYASIALGLCFLLGVIIYFIVSSLGKQALRSSLEMASGNVNEQLDLFFDQEKRDILYLKFLLEQDNVDASDVLEQYINLHTNVYQVRKLDSLGNERIKFIQDEDGIEKVPEEALQNKDGRKYFEDLESNPKGKVYFSDVELNREHGRIEMPPKPVLRFGVKYQNTSGQLEYLIINLNFYKLINSLQQLSSASKYCSIYITDQNNQFLYHPDEAKTWTLELDHRPSSLLSDYYPGLAERIKQANSGIFTSKNGWFYFNTVYNTQYSNELLFITTLHCDNNTIAESYIPIFINWTLALTIFFLLNLIPLWFWAKSQDEKERQSGEIKLRNEQLRKANDAKNKFFRIISHDLRSPLNSILALSELVKDETADSENKDLQEYVALMEESALNAKKMINDLFEWAKTQAESVSLNKTYFNLDLLKKQVNAEIKVVAEHKDIAIKWRYTAPIEVYADMQMINTVLRNLISNAIKFSYPNSEIEICVEDKETNYLFTVKDTGVGMSKEKAESLFQIGKTVSTPGTKNEQGTGLGLVLCKEFTQLHGGAIWVESTEGKGSSFIFTLPKP